MIIRRVFEAGEAVTVASEWIAWSGQQVGRPMADEVNANVRGGRFGESDENPNALLDQGVDGDFVFGHGLADYLTENAAIALLVKQRLWLWLSEWFLDVTAGVNWPAILGTRPPALRLAESEIRRTVLDTPGVVSITRFDMTFDHHIFLVQVYMEVTTEFSTGVVPIAFTQAFDLSKRAA